MKVVLIGNPNTGKSTLINAITGSREKTGNWPGVTIEKKTGAFLHEGKQITITDLPGIYSLTPPHESTPLDEKIAYDFLLQEKIDLVINVIDASKIERHLYLTSQLLERGIPTLIALNKMDLAKKNALFLDIEKLADKLGCPVIPLESHKKKGVDALKAQIIQLSNDPKKPKQTLSFPTVIENAIHDLESKLPLPESLKRATALSLLENPHAIESILSSDHSTHQPMADKDFKHLKNHLQSLQQSIEQLLGTEADIIIASTRYDFAHQTTLDITKQATHRPKISLSDLLDRIFLNRFLAIPLFLAIMYGLFFFSIHLGKVFQDFFEILGEATFVNGSAYWLTRIGMPEWLIAIVSQGIGKGINTTLSFIPVLSALFLALSFLEMSGYMARAAFIMDRLMKVIGLSGKSFIPLMIGFGCNVPAIMAARTLPNEKDRILTIMMAPFMSCSARLAIYSIFVTAFFPAHGENVIFLLYLIGILMAILTAWLLKKRLRHEGYDHTVIEIPDYHCPSPGILINLTFQRLKGFLLRAGAIIVPVSMVIYLLNAFTLDGSVNFQEWQPNSILAQLGKLLTPLFAPMGIQEENWPATVGLLSGILAKEVVIGTLNTLYSQTQTLIHQTIQTLPIFDFWESVRQALTSIPENFSALKTVFTTPFLTTLPNDEMTTHAYGILYERFNSKASAFAYLLFTLLYIPCISTFAAIAKELNRKWSLISVIWSTGLAYGTAVLFYQVATLPYHVLTSCIWILSVFLLLALTLFSVNQMAQAKAVSS